MDPAKAVEALVRRKGKGGGGQRGKGRGHQAGSAVAFGDGLLVAGRGGLQPTAGRFAFAYEFQSRAIILGCD